VTENPYESVARMNKVIRMVAAARAAGATPEIADDVDWQLAAKTAGVNPPSAKTIADAARMLRDRSLDNVSPLAGLPTAKTGTWSPR